MLAYPFSATINDAGQDLSLMLIWDMVWNDCIITNDNR